MYAIIETGGKQYRVREGDDLRVERLRAEQGDEVRFERVLAVGEGRSLVVGAPTVPGARVVARVLGHGRAKKVRVFKYKPKVNYRRRYGHRQPYTRVRVERIEPGDRGLHGE
ncbi:MAG: 50S ribosomal protein L21 [Clostridia bacterium]|nr:50S ribosomal protein L21 [Clostridia bacterium]